MSRPWLVDQEATDALWGELVAMPLRLVDGPGRWVADLGGGNGNFVWGLREKGARLLTIDTSFPALRSAPRDVRAVAASILHLPLRSGCLDAVAGRAVLHHVPDDLDAALREAKRVLRPGGLAAFQEPTSGNPIVNAVRGRFPTERHDPGERPLRFSDYVAAASRHFEVLEVRPHFLLSYLLPHVLARIPAPRRRLPRALVRALGALDRRCLAALPGLRSRAAYVSILARAPDD